MRFANLAFGTLGLISFPLFAQETAALLLSPRALARGETMVAAFESNEAARLNPASLAESNKRFQLRLYELEGFLGQNSFDTLSDLSQIASVDDSLGFLRKFETKFGKRQYLRAQLSAFSLRIKSFELQVFGSNASWLELRNPASPEAKFQSDTFAGAQFSYGHALTPQLMIGGNLKPLYRLSIGSNLSFTDIFEFVPPSELAFDDYAPLQSGIGYGADLGLIYRPSPMLRFGLSLTDLGDTAFSQDDPSLEPPSLEQAISLGMLYRLKFAAWDLDLSSDLQGIENREGRNLSQRTRFGAEFGRAYFGGDHDIGLSAGLREGYLTAGAFVNAYAFRLDIANYAVELGETPGQRMDRRWAAKLQSSLSF